MQSSIEPTPSAISASISDLTAASQRKNRFLFLVLSTVALVYAFLAGLATVGDPDLGWHLATGRWVAQHHHVFSTDVFSYTVPGAPAIYPAGGGLLLYWAFLLGGYKLLSWLSAVACVATVALLLRRGSVVTAAIAIVATTFIAFRSVPRAELFVGVLFAAYVSILWEYYQTGKGRLWLLPLLMLVWVNVHLSFFSGLGLLIAFAGMDVLELPYAGERRARAWQRLKHEVPWFFACGVATLANPWGWRFYPALVDYTRVVHTLYINEWAPLHWNWLGIGAMSLRNTSGMFQMLFLIALVAMVTAVAQGKLGPAILVGGAAYEATRHVRMVALASCILVVVAGAVLTSTLPWIRARIQNPRTRSVLATAATVLFAALGIMRATDVVTNYHYLAERNLSTFGTGLSQWFPRRAAEFIARQNLPGEVLNTFNEGGYVLWALGPERRDYIDGRGVPFGESFAQHGGELLSTSLDSPLWEQEAQRYGINTIIFPLTLDEISLERVKSDCASHHWRPVYLDEVSMVLVRSTPQAESLIQRFEVNCATAPVPREKLPLTAAAFDSWLDAARVLAALGRNSEALAAADNAMTIFPGSAHAHWYRGQILHAMQRNVEAEQEWQEAIGLASHEATPWASVPDFQANVWSSLADLYHHDERVPEAIGALESVIRLSSDQNAKVEARANLGALYLDAGRTADAEKQWLAALAVSPNQSLVWLSLADLYQRDGRVPQAIHALQEGTRLASDPTVKTQNLLKLARLEFVTHQPQLALQSLNEAAQNAPPEMLSDKTGRSFSFDLAQGKAAVWMALGDLSQATSFEEQAVALDPQAPDAWSRLAKLYEREGRTADQQRAEARSKTLGQPSQP